MSSHDDITPLTNKGYSPVTTIPSSSQRTHAVKQKKGQFAASGTQPSLALELDISTIKHVNHFLKEKFHRCVSNLIIL